MNIKKIFKELVISFSIGIIFLLLMIAYVKMCEAGISGGGTGTSTPEGTAVKSTGEAGGTKFLREDGDGTCSWQTPAGGGDMTNAVEGAAIAADTTTLGSTKANLASPTFTGIVTTPDLTVTYGVACATVAASGAITGTTLDTGQGANELYDMNQNVQTTSDVTFNKITSTTDLTAASMTITGTGQSSLNAGLIINEDGGATSTDDFRVETNTETDMIRTSAYADTMTLGGTANGIMVAKGGQMSFIGTNDGNEIGGLHWEKSYTITSPSQTYLVAGSSVCLIGKVPKAITITNVEVTLDASANELTGDLKVVDTFIGLANPAIINDIDTTSGVRSDSSITAGALAAGKCLMLFFDAQPHAAIKQLNITLTGNYD